MAYYVCIHWEKSRADDGSVTNWNGFLAQKNVVNYNNHRLQTALAKVFNTVCNWYK